MKRHETRSRSIGIDAALRNPARALAGCAAARAAGAPDAGAHARGDRLAGDSSPWSSSAAQAFTLTRFYLYPGMHPLNLVECH